jgi:hypothetical protein
VGCSEKYGFDMATVPLPAILLINGDFAIEWTRPLPPNVKMIGPAMLEQPKELPEDLLVCLLSRPPHQPCHLKP